MTGPPPADGGAPSVSATPYTLITADTHAGASIDMYREYLDPKYRSEFDAWRGAAEGGGS